MLAILIAPVLFPCHAFRTNDAHGAEQYVEGVPPQYVVSNSKLVDITGFFNSKVLIVGQTRYRCCKSDADGLGVLKAESADDLINSCSSLVGSGFKSFIHFPKPKCVVASSALPSKVLPLVDGVVGVKGARVVGELIDLSQGEVTLANGRRVRCCTAQDARASVLVEPSKQENLLDGTALAGLHRLGSFNNKKCKGLLGKTYHSWDKWAGNRCVVMSQDIPADILEVLKWNEEEEKEEEEEEAEPVQSEPEPVPEQPVPEPEPEPPTQPPQPTPQPTSWHLNVRVVSATTSHIIRGAAVRLLKEDRSILFTGTSDDGGWVAFQVPRSVEKVVVDIEAEGFDPNSRLYKWDHPNGRSDCGGRENCMTQMALNPVFR